MQTGYPSGKPPRLSEEEYKKGMLKWVKFCHDVVPIGPHLRFYLPTRRLDKNCPGPWFVGGQAIPFVDLFESLVATVKRETGITFSPERFAYLGENRYFMNGKEPGGIPHDAFCKIYTLHLTVDEVIKIKLDPDEYEGGALTPYGADEVRNIKDPFTREIFLNLWQVYNTSVKKCADKKVDTVTRKEEGKEHAMTDRFQSFMTELKEMLTPLYTMPNAPGGHDVWHVARVAKMGERIRKQCPRLVFNLQEYEVAAWLHNMDRVEPFRSSIEHLNENGRTSKESVSIVANTTFEGDHPFSIEAKDRIVDVVVQHPKKDDEPGDSHLLTALRIADKLDRLNPLGLMSAVAFRGSNLPLYDPKHPLAYGTTVEGRMKSVYDDFFRVLEWVGMLPSNEARALIVKEDLLAHINFVRAVGVQLSRECGVKNTAEDDIKKALGSFYGAYATNPKSTFFRR